jgi:Flp pilus assembly protein TadG
MSPRRAREHGQALPEFALVATIFFLLIFGVVQVGLIMAAQNGLVDAVRNAARRAATYRINEQSFDATVWSSICGTIADELDNQLGDDRTGVVGFSAANRTSSVAYEWQQNPETGEYFLAAVVSATYANPLYVPLIAAFLDRSDGVVDDAIRLSASEKMRVENPALLFPSGSPPTPPVACIRP